MEGGKLARFTYGGLCVLQYALNEDPNCVLDCDVDVLNMLMVLNVVGKSIVEILVMDKCHGSMRVVFELNGDDVDAYKFLPWYVEYACSSNPGSVVELEVVPESNRFLRLFIAYDAWIKEIFEVVYAIVDSETITNWRWFFAIVYGILRPQGRNVSTLFPKATSEGLKKKMMNLLANCAYSCTPSDFDDYMAEFKDNGKGHVKNFLCDLQKEGYAIAHFPDQRWGSMSNTLSESFNAMVSNSCCMPLLDLLEDIRVWLMGSMAEKRIFGQNIHTILCPKKENKMKLMLKEGMHWRFSCSDVDVFEVRMEWNQFVVLQHDNRDVFYYVDDYWKASFY
ncbi:uncharacterized protein LOC108866083 [Pyrus x bretschneideri]|uniref:uncharacterized protein LOC108866083 n=1 Tax=Pyrus x bretschneideri TaxID=225117 RepID=UPI00202E101E|nr:uncharacterized protein LOC108866083 [Pyrus x bretschneideri]